MKKKGCFVAFGVTAGVIAVAVMILVVTLPRYRDSVRNQWKVDTIAAINRLASDTNSVAAAITSLAAQTPKGGTDDGWISDHLILMANGDWIVYDNICTKSDWRIADIFIGHASDGKWYYSTFHFCIGAIVLRLQGRPADLATFVKEYYLSEFTGQATEILGVTWPRSKRTK